MRNRLIKAVRANQNADDLFDECVVDFLGVNRSDGRCLDIVDRLGRTTAGRLAAESGLTTGAVTALVDRMEQAGYLQRTRDTEDRRRVWIEVTDRTRQLNQRLFGHLAFMLPPLFERFTPEQIEGIVQFLEVSTWINRQRAALLQDHLVASNATPDERAEQADAFAKAAEDLAHCVGDQIRGGKLPEDFCDPAKEI
ncbi:MAG: MarR family transcriptional regulator [Hyphomicrobiales bacterium]|nr:MarR family transcriptional regulator [Hyphomicrobiales bacterium]